MEKRTDGGAVAAGRTRPAREGIYFRDRATGEVCREVVYSERILSFFYDHPLGRAMGLFVARRWVSLLYGSYMDSRLSRRKIRPFMEALRLAPEEAELPIGRYATFNQYFARRLAPGLRRVDPDPETLVSSADARVLVAPVLGDTLEVKGARMDLETLLGDPALAQEYRGGSAVVYRLCPSDYHRFHFPDSGVPCHGVRIRGRYHSVSPFALEKGLPVHARNVRERCAFLSEAFGRMVLMEVGAFGVGGIVQTYRPDVAAPRGAEKGFFKFGASSLVHFFLPGRVEFDADLVLESSRGMETLVRFGTVLGRRRAGS